MKKGFSVIMCCYNSSELLRETILKICGLKTDENFSAEVLIIDNASTDNTADVCDKYLKEFNCPFPYKILFEQRQGLSFARKKGIDNAEFEYIIFCDDDNRLDENYLIESFRIMNKNPEIGALGGISEQVTDSRIPEWFNDFRQSYSIGRQSEKNGEIKSVNHSLWGAGMVLRSTAIKGLYKKGFYSLLSDRTGEYLSSGGDTELCYALRLTNWKIWFDDRLKLFHYLPQKRLTWEYLRELNRGFGRQKINFDAYLLNLSSNDFDKDEISWEKKMIQMIKKMRFYGFKKILNFKKPNTGDPEIIRMEKTIGSMQELFKLKNEYNKIINKTSNSDWISKKENKNI